MTVRQLIIQANRKVLISISSCFSDKTLTDKFIHQMKPPLTKYFVSDKTPVDRGHGKGGLGGEGTIAKGSTTQENALSKLFQRMSSTQKLTLP